MGARRGEEDRTMTRVQVPHRFSQPPLAEVTSSMRVLTLKEPWATMLVSHGKNIENRSRNIAGNYRGPVAIHAALRALPTHDPAWQVAAASGLTAARGQFHLGRIIGVVDLVDVTPWTPYVQDTVGDSSPGARTPREPVGWELPDHWHLHLANPHALEDPIPYPGALALRRLDTDIAVRVLARLEEAGASPRMPARMIDNHY